MGPAAVSGLSMIGQLGKAGIRKRRTACFSASGDRDGAAPASAGTAWHSSEVEPPRWQPAVNVAPPANALKGEFRDATLLSAACIKGHACAAVT
jgi:hypothetical protein